RIVPLQELRDEIAAVGSAFPAVAASDAEHAEPAQNESESYLAGEELVLESLAARERKPQPPRPSRREARASRPTRPAVAEPAPPAPSAPDAAVADSDADGAAPADVDGSRK